MTSTGTSEAATSREIPNGLLLAERSLKTRATVSFIAPRTPPGNLSFGPGRLDDVYPVEADGRLSDVRNPESPMSPIVRILPLLLLALATLSARAEPLRFLAIGDLPYLPGEDLLMETLLAQELPRGSPFLVHVGDTKRGSAPCTDDALAVAAEIFRRQPVPVAYTPGDNEWTDCRRQAAGGYDPEERLAQVRRTYFGDPGVLRLAELNPVVPDPAYPENYRFARAGAHFVAVHVVGSHNNLQKGDNREYQARNAANRRHLRAAAAAARDGGARAMVILFHANPGLEKPRSPKGFGPLREDLLELLGDYAGPVLAIHGDTHRYRFDQPLTDPKTGEAVKRFVRLEVPGSPTVGAVWVSIDPQAPEPFAVELVYPNYRDALAE